MKQQYNAITPTVVIPIPEKQQYLKVTYLIDDSLQCPIVTNPMGIKSIRIDGGKWKTFNPSTDINQTFPFSGEHTVEFMLTDETTIQQGMFSSCTNIVNIEIPDTIKTIGDGFISNNHQLKSIVIPASVTNNVYIAGSPSLEHIEIYGKISSESFNGCSNLKSVKIGKNVILNGVLNGITLTGDLEIDTGCTIQNSFSGLRFPNRGNITIKKGCTINNSFNGITNYSTLYIDGVTVSQSFAAGSSWIIDKITFGKNFQNPNGAANFYGSGKLNSVEILCDSFDLGDISTYFSYLPETLEFHCKHLTNTKNRSINGVKNLIIGDEVETITNNTFISSASDLTYLKLGKSLTELPNYFLQDASALTYIYIPKNIKRIGTNAFSASNNLPTEVKLEGPVRLEQGCFSGRLLGTLDVPKGSELYQNSYTKLILHDGGECIKDAYFLTYVSMSEIEYKDSPDVYNSSAGTTQSYTKNLAIISFNPSLKRIEDKTFYYFAYLRYISIPKTVKAIGYRTFYQCTRLVSALIEAEEIKEEAFAYCARQANEYALFDIKSKVIGDYAFSNMGNYSYQIKFIFSDNLEKIGNYVFQSTHIDARVPLNTSNCKYVGDYAFYQVSSSYYVTSLDKVEYIGDHAFEKYSYGILNPSIILTNAKYIGNSAFKNSNSTYKLVLGENLEYLGESAFSGCSTLNSALVIPDSIKVIPAFCFSQCSYIPSVTLGKNTEEIKSNAFYSCPRITTVNFPETVKKIGASAFLNCSALATITGGENIEEVGQNAFNSTAWLNNQPNGPVILGKTLIAYKGNIPTTVSIPEGVVNVGTVFANTTVIEVLNIPSTLKNISSETFRNAKNLISIQVHPDNSQYNSANNCNSIIETNTNKIIKGSASSVIADNITEISDYAFYQITFNENSNINLRNIKNIGDSAFYGVVLSETTINLENIENIGANAFDSAKLICDELIIGNNIKTIGTDAFRYKTTSTITKVKIYDLNTWCKIEFSGSYGNPLYIGKLPLYLNDEELTNVVIPDDITKLNATFRGCSSIVSVDIPGEVEINSAFYSCNNLRTVNLLGSNYKIQGSWPANLIVNISSLEAWLSITFAGDDHATIPSNPLYSGADGHLYVNGQIISDLEIPNNVTTIKKFAFAGDRDLTSVTIPEGVTTLEAQAFVRCRNLTQITLPSSLQSIGVDCFYECDNLSKIYINDLASWTSLSKYNASIKQPYDLYLNNTLVTDLNIPNGITLAQASFKNCRSITSVTIPSSINVEYPQSFSNPFYNCTNITELTINANNLYVPYLGCQSVIEKLVYGEGVTTINGATSFSNLTTAIIPSSVTQLPNSTFSSCPLLTSITINRPTPPTLGTSDTHNIFKNCPSGFKIYVPASAVDTYKTANRWSAFADNIEAIPTE